VQRRVETAGQAGSGDLLELRMELAECTMDMDLTELDEFE
jgi:hypothetical protein